MSEEKEPPMKILVLDKMSALIAAAFGLVADLAWNEAIKAIFKEIFGSADSIGPMLAYRCNYCSGNLDNCCSKSS